MVTRWPRSSVLRPARVTPILLSCLEEVMTVVFDIYASNPHFPIYDMTPVPLLVFLYVGFFVLPEDVDAARRVEGEQQLIKRGGRADVVERELDVLKAEEPAGLWAVSHARAFGEQKHTHTL